MASMRSMAATGAFELLLPTAHENGGNYIFPYHTRLSLDYERFIVAVSENVGAEWASHDYNSIRALCELKRTARCNRPSTSNTNVAAMGKHATLGRG